MYWKNIGMVSDNIEYFVRMAVSGLQRWPRAAALNSEEDPSHLTNTEIIFTFRE